MLFVSPVCACVGGGWHGLMILMGVNALKLNFEEKTIIQYKRGAVFPMWPGLTSW